MSRLLGVKIQRARRRYTDIIQIGRRSAGSSRLTTLSPQQETAEIDVYLLKADPKGSQSSSAAEQGLREIRKLHQFTVHHAQERDGTRPLFQLDARHLGGRRYELRLSRDGVFTDAATVRVPRSPGTVAAIVAAILLLALLGGLGINAFFRDRGRNNDRAGRDTFQESTATQGANDGSSGVAGRSGGDSDNADEARVVDDEPKSDRAPAASAVTTSSEAPAPSGAPAASAVTTSSEAPAPSGAPAASAVTTPSGAPTGDAVDTAGTAQAATEEPPPSVTHTETVYFFPDSISLTARNRRTLDELASLLSRSEVLSIRVEGHTALYGNEAGREMISTGRIDSVLSYLKSQGWVAEPQPEEYIRGATQPVTRATDQQYRNRRAEITVTYRRDE